MTALAYTSNDNLTMTTEHEFNSTVESLVHHRDETQECLGLVLDAFNTVFSCVHFVFSCYVVIPLFRNSSNQVFEFA